MARFPNFNNHRTKEVLNFLTKEKYLVFPAHLITHLPKYIESIKECCNEEEIYKWLFKERCPDGYQEKDARGFISWAQDGWQKGEFFVFFVLSPEDRIVGAIDIKSNDLNAGEVGYWISSKHRGLATNCVELLKIKAREAGYRGLFAQTREGNDSSVGVLIRAGFRENEEYLRSKKCTRAFHINL